MLPDVCRSLVVYAVISLPYSAYSFMWPMLWTDIVLCDWLLFEFY